MGGFAVYGDRDNFLLCKVTEDRRSVRIYKGEVFVEELQPKGPKEISDIKLMKISSENRLGLYFFYIDNEYEIYDLHKGCWTESEPMHLKELDWTTFNNETFSVIRHPKEGFKLSSSNWKQSKYWYSVPIEIKRARIEIINRIIYVACLGLDDHLYVVKDNQVQWKSEEAVIDFELLEMAETPIVLYINKSNQMTAFNPEGDFNWRPRFAIEGCAISRFKDNFNCFYLLMGDNEIFIYKNFKRLLSFQWSPSLNTASILSHQIQDNKKIGSGSYSDVYRSRFLDVPCVIKVPNDSGRWVASYELSVLSLLNHPNIIKLLGARESIKGYELILEEADNGDLTDYLHRLPFKDRWVNEYNLIAHGIARALMYLHENGFIHLDLKPENVVLDSELNPRLIDFAGLVMLPQDSQSIRLEQAIYTFRYSAPEILKKPIVAYLGSDIYSFAAVIYAMAKHRHPWMGSARPPQELKRHIIAGGRPKLGDNYPEPIKTVVDKCHQADPQKRPTASELVKSFGLFKETKLESLDLDNSSASQESEDLRSNHCFSLVNTV